jgi:hypothetical protein
MRLSCSLLVASAAASLAVGCGPTTMRVASLEDLERVRATPMARESAQVAPEAYARAEQQRDLARRAHEEHDDVLANIYAEHAVAAYQHALVVARLARASTELVDAQKALDETSLQVDKLEATRADLDRDARELEQRVQLARQRMLPAQSEKATPEREAARLAVARSFAVEARLLCGAARLVAAECTPPDAGAAAGLAEADAARTKVEPLLDKGARPVPIDDAARARAACLEALTKERRTCAGPQGDEGGADALLAEISATGGWDAARNDRGVVVTVRGAFKGKELADGWAAKLGDLGRVAKSHPAFVLQVVVHDADQPGPKDEVDIKRAEATVKALVDGGAVANRIDTELAGARAPVVDPADRKLRARNERLEVVFVPTGK